MDHDHSGMGMGSNSTSTDDMGGMDMSCKISMLWNWNTVGACFISNQWRISSKGVFAGTIIGIFFLVVAVELVRRLAREYDRHIAKQHAARLEQPSSSEKLAALPMSPVNALSSQIRPTVGQQAIRSTLYMIQFGAGYMMMLLAMYYNGYILIFGIFLGAWAGHFLTAWDTVGHGEPVAKDCCC
ncbi:Ctr-domain-containing protein [Auricularia subglabra TFB-10046 SS5]|nr:Ctr-domain-containing protein [Auricularia subglabra TFB-10046 SS5]